MSRQDDENNPHVSWIPPHLRAGTASSHQPGTRESRLDAVTRFLDIIPSAAGQTAIGGPAGTAIGGPAGTAICALSTTPSVKAATFDDDKVPLSRVPWAGVDALARAQAYGHRKYGDFENYRKGMEISRNLSCALRHIRDFMDGQDLDAESGVDHLGHAMARIAFVIQNRHDGVAIDDRYNKRERK